MPYLTWREPYRSWGQRAANIVDSDASIMLALGIAFLAKASSLFLLAPEDMLFHRFDTILQPWLTALGWALLGLAQLCGAKYHREPIGVGIFAIGVVAISVWAGAFLWSGIGLFLSRGSFYGLIIFLILRSVWKSGKATADQAVAVKEVSSGGRIGDAD